MHARLDHSLSAFKFILIQNRLFSISRNPQVQRQVNVGDRSIANRRRAADVAVPTFELAIITIIDLKYVVPAIRVKGLNKPIILA